MQEKKKLDIIQFIGFLLIGIVLFWFGLNRKEESEINFSEKENNHEIISQKKEKNKINGSTDDDTHLKKQYDIFLFPNQNEEAVTLENEVLKLKISNKGAQIVKAQLKKYTNFQNLPVVLIDSTNMIFNLRFGTKNHPFIDTKHLIFESSLLSNGKNKIAVFKSKISDTQYLTYRYELKPDDYMLDFSIHSVGMEDVIHREKQIHLEWNMMTKRQEKSISYENQMTALHYEKENQKYDDLSIGKEDETTEKNVDWIGYKQHFFSTILLSNSSFEKATLVSKSLVNESSKDSQFTKSFSSLFPLKLTNGALQYPMKFYIGPNIYKKLMSYDRGIENIMNLGWGIFGWINRNAFIPIFQLLNQFIDNYGIIIILMTLIIRVIMSPLVYKSYVSSAKMKILRPEIDLINSKFPGKQNQMKRQMEILNLQRKSNVSMMSGCIPAILQMPVFFALFRFFPSEIRLRQKSFLWADDLSSYDSIFEWSTHIPVISTFYGNHFSLFPLLASIAIFFYMKMNQAQQTNMQQVQEGALDIQKMMKFMIYLSPIMMLFFFNNYASGLSLYYFISNLLTLIIMYIIKNFFIDEKKILTKIHENRKKPEKQSKFRQQLNAVLKQAQEKQEKNRNAKK